MSTRTDDEIAHEEAVPDINEDWDGGSDGDEVDHEENAQQDDGAEAHGDGDGDGDDDNEAANGGKKRKWARQQVKEMPTSKYQRIEGQNEYNIWYHRWSGDTERVRVAATTRCDPERDTGLTRADLTRPDTYVCIHFAKGQCVHGKKCNYLHRVPTAQDDDRLDLMHDIFGRERHQSDRDDMGGVGTFSRECRTLYIGNLPIDSVSDTYKALARHFGMYGDIEGINVKPKYGCAFVRFLYRANAEFAKIAMAEQSLDADEQLNVRWAHEDPNPAVIRQVEAEKKQRVLDALAAQGHNADAARYNAPANYAPDSSAPPSNRAAAAVAYPNTDSQYEQQRAEYSRQYSEYQKQYDDYVKQHYAFYGPDGPPPAPAQPPAPPAGVPMPNGAGTAPLPPPPLPDQGVDAFTPMTPEMYRRQQQLGQQ